MYLWYSKEQQRQNAGEKQASLDSTQGEVTQSGVQMGLGIKRANTDFLAFVLWKVVFKMVVS